MGLQIWFWVLMLIWLFFGWYGNYAPGQPYPWQRWGPNVLLFILIAILGYAAFGGPVK